MSKEMTVKCIQNLPNPKEPQAIPGRACSLDLTAEVGHKWSVHRAMPSGQATTQSSPTTHYTSRVEVQFPAPCVS